MSRTQGLVSLKIAAEILGCGTSTLRTWDNDGSLKAVRTPGGQRRYRMEDLERFQKMSGFITAVRYDANHPAHSKHPIITAYLVDGEEWGRERLLKELARREEGTFRTRTPQGQQAAVRLSFVGPKFIPYIRTIRDDTPADNLGGLPQF